MRKVQRIESGFLLSEERYKELMQAEYEQHFIRQEIDNLLYERERQSQELHYWLDPNGGYQQRLREAEEKEYQWLKTAMRDPVLKIRLKERLKEVGLAD